jgi:hypothetical protein
MLFLHENNNTKIGARTVIRKFVHIRKITTVAFAIALTCACSIATAQETGADFEANALELFLGFTYDDSENEPSIGMTYERRMQEKFGWGLIVEFTDSATRETVVAVPFFWHPAEPWRVLAAAGVEKSDGANNFLFRVGGSYEIGFSGWSLSPEVNVDFVDRSAVLVYGVSFGWKF